MTRCDDGSIKKSSKFNPGVVYGCDEYRLMGEQRHAQPSLTDSPHHPWCTDVSYRRPSRSRLARKARRLSASISCQSKAPVFHKCIPMQDIPFSPSC